MNIFGVQSRLGSVSGSNWNPIFARRVGGGAPAERTITHQGITWTVEGATASGVDVAGRPYIVVPTGTATITSVSPDITVASGNTVNGLMLNPMRGAESNAPHGLDQRESGYDAELLQSLPLEVSAGDIAIKVASRLSSTSGRAGAFDGISALHVLSAVPSGQFVLGSSIGWAGKSTPAFYPVDLDAWYAARMVKPAPSDMPPYETLMACLSLAAPTIALRSATSGGGYERFQPWNFSGRATSDAGYGRFVGAMIAVALTAIASDAYSSEEDQIKSIAAQITGHGIEWGDVWLYGPYDTDADGAHKQFHQGPTAFALMMTGRADEIPNIMTKAPGSYGQAFKITQDMLDNDFVRHTDLNKPLMYRERTLPVQPGGAVVRIPLVTPGSITSGDHVQTTIPPGSRIIRVSDGEEVVVTAVTEITNTSTLDIGVNSTSPFAEGDVIYMEPAASAAPVLGQYDWSQRGYDATNKQLFSPSAANEYRSLQSAWMPMLLSMKILGIYDDSMDSVRGYIERVNAADDPASDNDYFFNGQDWNPTGEAFQYTTEWYADHWNDAFADEQVTRVLVLGQSQARIATNQDASVFTTQPTAGTVRIIEGQTHNAGFTAVPQTNRVIGVSGYVGTDALRAMGVAFQNIAGPDAKLEVMFDVIGGTGVLSFVDDTDDNAGSGTGGGFVRRWSDLQEKLDLYGDQFDVILIQWDTANQSALEGNQEIDILLGLDTHGFTVDHSLADLTPGYVMAIGPATRHATVFQDEGHSRQKMERAVALGLPIGLTTLDYYTDGTGPHPASAENGNTNLGVHWGILMARAAGIEGTPENPYLTGARRSADGLTIRIDVAMPNGGTLSSVEPEVLSGWRYRIDGGASVRTGFTARIEDAANGVVAITLDSAEAWPLPERLNFDKTIMGSLNDPFNAAVERAIVDGELYETSSIDPTGRGLPVAGTRNESGQWLVPEDYTILNVTQDGLAELGAANATVISSNSKQDVGSSDLANRNPILPAAFGTPDSGDKFLMTTIMVSSFSGSVDVTAHRSLNVSTTVAENTTFLASINDDPGGRPRSIKASAFTATGAETRGQFMSASRQMMWSVPVYELDTSLITDTGAVSATGVDDVTIPDVLSGSTVLAFAFSAAAPGAAAITWSGVTQDGFFSADSYNSQGIYQAWASAGTTSDGIVRVRAIGAAMLAVVVLPPV